MSNLCFWKLENLLQNWVLLQNGLQQTVLVYILRNSREIIICVGCDIRCYFAYSSNYHYVICSLFKSSLYIYMSLVFVILNCQLEFYISFLILKYFLVNNFLIITHVTVPKRRSWESMREICSRWTIRCLEVRPDNNQG